MGELEDLTRHVPVLVHEVLAGLNIKPGGCYLDATVGGGGHAVAILEAAGPDGRLLGLDRDPEAAARAATRLQRFGAQAQVIHTSYAHLREVLSSAGMSSLDGALFDLGFSSWQVDDPTRGFAFRVDGPLDMRFNPGSDEPTAADLVNRLPEAELVGLLRRYGEEPHSRRIAQAIVAARPIRSTGRLADVIVAAVGRSKKEKIHPATRTFQALRIAVNRELDTLEQALPQAVTALRPGGRLAIITFHSLEDRIVKHFLKQEERGCICPPEVPVCTCGRQPTLHIVTRKPLVPSAAEIAANPRSRSAKLRVAEKLCGAVSNERSGIGKSFCQPQITES
ncbi:MAG TPA: 16S rRNA (cytosine(1402)-N(4))-methyltransferase RsmH [Anaerolineae bacterium]|nr:16S rRNA (cytosine(1402)-N(4))-methyltransferase RsmH [Anaerolineae bacterium]HQI86062.1 16S rRNA (cytosine(1402)-N(4))-methyltransferase RsmH [Anaerolineae bacterium]